MHVGTSERKWSQRSPRHRVALLAAVAVATVFVGSAMAVIALTPGTAASPKGPASTVSPRSESYAGSTGPSAAGGPRPSASALQGVLSTIDLVDNRTLPGATAPPEQDDPGSIVFDSANGDLYVRGALGTAVNVVNATTYRVVTSLVTPASQNSYVIAPTIVVDPVTDAVYTMNYNEGNISVINGETNTITGSLGTGLSPTSGVFDPNNGFLYVSDWTPGEVSIINGANDHFVSNISVNGTHPGALLYDPVSDEVFVANYGSSNVSVIDTTSNKLVKTISTGAASTYPQVLALDTHDNYVDVGSEVTYNISVISAATLSLVGHPHVSYDSDGLAYAPVQNELFVENGGEGNLTVFNQSESDRVVANITTGADPEGIAFDPLDQEVYALNSGSENISVINPSTHHIVASISSNDGLDYGVAVDPANGNVFVVSEGTYTGSVRGYQANVTVIQDSTNLPIASVPVEVFPVGLTFDPGNGELVAADVGGQDVYLLNTTTQFVEGTAPTGYAWESVYDSKTGDLWVYNWGSDNITVLNSALHSVANLALGPYPLAIAFDSSNGDVYVPDGSAGDVWVFDGATNTFLTTIPVTAGADLNAVLYDPHNQEVYVSDETGKNLTIINGSSQRTVGSIPTGLDTLSLAFDSTNNTIWAANSGNFTVISDATNKSVANVPYTYASGLLSFDAANNVMYDAEGFESVVAGIGGSNYTALGTIYLGENYYTSGIAYDPVDHDVYVSTADNGMISVIGPVASFPVEFVESGLPQGTHWSVSLAGNPESNTAPASIDFTEPAGSYPFSVGSVLGYTANVTSGSVAVTTGPKTVEIGFVPTNYSVTFVEAGLPSGSLWNVTLNSVQNHSTTNSIGFLEPAGSYSFTVGRFAGYRANVTSGTVHVTTSNVIVEIGFTAANSDFPVTFTESGLPSSTEWSVTFHGAPNSSATSSIGFYDPNGTWPFTVGTVSGYTANVTSGSVTVKGQPVTVEVGFSANASVYPVNFTESGLPASTSWTVTLAGTPKSNTTPTIGFSEPDGSYAFTVGTVLGYSASPNSGSAVVSGGPFQQTIVFKLGVVALSVELSASPTSLTLGNSTTITTTTSGGSPPFTYVYGGLPSGCVSENVSSFSCKPTTTGSFSINVTVTDALRDSAKASASLTVSSSSSSSPSSSGVSSLWIVIAVVVVVAVLVVFFLLWRRRRRPPAPVTPTPPPASPPESPPPSP